jgi:hypothetical protein
MLQKGSIGVGTGRPRDSIGCYLGATWAVMRVLGKQDCSANGYELRIRGRRQRRRHGNCVAFVPKTLIGSGG